MTAPATELQKLLDMRDEGVLTDEEFAQAKDAVLKPAPPPIVPREPGLLDRVTANVLTLVAAVGVLVGAATLIALTEAGAIALLSLALIALVLVGFWLLKETF